MKTQYWSIFFILLAWARVAGSDDLSLVEDGAANPPAKAAPKAEARIIFRPAREILKGGRVRLSNGIEVDRRDWPTLVMAKMPIAGKDATCTASLVGPNAMLLAAHCIDTLSGKPRPAELWTDGARVKLKCAIHPKYLEGDYSPGSTRASEDFALCLLLGRSPSHPANALFEVIDTSGELRAGEPVVMTGYGCSKLEISDRGQPTTSQDPGILRIGDEKVDTAPGQWQGEPLSLAIRSVGGKEPALCPGDSGGPLLSGISAAAPTGARRIRGVNSKYCVVRGNEASSCQAPGTIANWDVMSIAASVGNPTFRDWALKWIAENSGDAPIVCGVNRKAGEAPCRP